jgi:WD40 repeat protein
MNQVNVVAFAPDGKTVASKGHDSLIRVWEATTGKEVRTLPTLSDEGTSNLCFTPDGKALASVGAEEGVLHLWELATGNELRRFTGHKGRVPSLAISPDGKTLGSAGFDRTARLWDLATGKELHRLDGHTGLVSGVRFSPDGKTLASCAVDRTIRLWDVATGKEQRVIEGHAALVSEVAFSPDGKVLASACWDQAVKLWDVATGKELPQSYHEAGAVTCAALSADGKVLVTGHRDDAVRFWEPATGKRLPGTVKVSGGVVDLALSGDGKSLAVRARDEKVTLWDAATAKPRAALDAKAPVTLTGLESFSTRPGSLALSGDGKVLAALERQEVVRLCDAATGRELKHSPLKTGAAVYSAAFLPDGKTLATLGGDATLRLWDAATGREVRDLGNAGAESFPRVSFGHDGRALALVDGSGAVRVWEMATGQQRLSFQRRAPAEMEGGAPEAVALSPDGRAVAVAEPAAKAITLWSVLTGKQVRLLEGHRGEVTSLAFTADGRLLVSASEDGTALVWEVSGLARASLPEAAKLERGQAEGLWEKLASRDADEAFRALRRLHADPGAVVALLRERLKASDAVDAAGVAKLIAQLDDDDFQVREKASKELERLAADVAPALREALDKGPSAEMERRLRELLKKTEGGALPSERLRAGRALEVLEQIGTPEARKAIEELAKGSGDAWLTQEAKASLGRLARRAP